jgi:uncharacterized delta-60 repeat protein
LPWILLLLLCCPDSTSAQPGSIDPSFSPNFDGSKQVDSVAFQADGKILIARDILSRGTGLPLIIRLNTDGTLDPSFDSSSVPLNRIFSIKTAFDGKILVAGVFTNGFLTNGLGRLHADGTLDSIFAPRLPFGDKLQSFAALPDGRVLVAGLAEEPEEETKEDPPGILRLNLDGSLDSTFHPGSAPNLGIAGILPLEDGRTLGTVHRAFRKHPLRTCPAQRRRQPRLDIPAAASSFSDFTLSYDSRRGGPERWEGAHRGCFRVCRRAGACRDCPAEG